MQEVVDAGRTTRRQEEEEQQQRRRARFLVGVTDWKTRVNHESEVG
jgi:hypothetical protein